MFVKIIILVFIVVTFFFYNKQMFLDFLLLFKKITKFKKQIGLQIVDN